MLFRSSYTMGPDHFYYEPSILSYEGGHLNCNGFNLVEAAIDQKNEIGLTNIINKGDELLQALIKGLRSLNIKILGEDNLENRAGIVCISGTPDQHDLLRKENVIVTFRNSHFRIGPHFYNSNENILDFLNFIEKV